MYIKAFSLCFISPILILIVMTTKLELIKYVLCYVFILTIFFVINFFIVDSKLNANYLPYKSPEISNIQYDITRPPNIDYETLTDDINQMFNNPSYKLTFTNFSGSTKGECYMFSKTIVLQENMNYEYYVFCLTHELVHLTEFTYSERYTNLTAFYTLYNSENEYFKNIALYFADLDLQGIFKEEYSFVGYIEL